MKYNLLSTGKRHLRAKTILAVLAVAAALIILMLWISHAIILRGFEDLERTAVATDMARMRALLEQQIQALNIKAKDWALWDDTYSFITDRNERYIMTNLLPSAAVYLDINLMAFVDQSRQMVYSLFVDLEKEEAVPVPPGLSQLILEGPLGHHDNVESNIAGIVNYDGNAMMVASWPILTSRGEGPVNGALVFARLLDQSFVDSLAAAAKMDLDSIVFTNGVIPNDAGIPPELSGGAPTAVQATGPDSIKGYVLLNDPFGQPVMLLTAEMPRDIYQRGQDTVRAFIFWSVGLVLSTTFIFVLVLELLVVRRLTKLTNDIVDIGEACSGKRVFVSGSDEISTLSRSINRTLDALEERTIQLRLENAITNSILATIPAAVALIDRAGQVVKANQGFWQLFADGRGEHTDTALSDIPGIEPLTSQLHSALTEGESRSFEFRYGHNGAEKLIIADIVPVGGRQLLVLRDVTDERKRQEQLYLVDRLSAVGIMAAGAAHELNNPLTSIVGFSQLLREKNIPDDVRQDVELIYNEAQRAAIITKNLLTFARKHTPVKQLGQINNIVEDVLKLRAYELNVNGIKVEKCLAPDLPEIMVDYLQMQQVFLNIIINAEYFMIEAHGKGTLTITTEKQNSNVIISIADDGPGIPQENLGRIFDPFFTTKPVGKGTGLGLSICHTIVAQHGGQIYARSQLGKGATFIVELPITARDHTTRRL
jgi:signal transduction histidine kinase